MLVFELAGERKIFIDNQKIFVEIECKVVQSSKADTKYDDGAGADVTNTDASYFFNNVFHFFFSDDRVSANWLKISIANRNYYQKSFVENVFSLSKDAKATCLATGLHSWKPALHKQYWISECCWR